MIGTVGENSLSDWPHPRHLCVTHPFNNSRTNHKLHCANCYCYICDIPAKDCLSWASDHCHATDKNPSDVRKRRLKKQGQPSLILSSPSYTSGLFRGPRTGSENRATVTSAHLASSSMTGAVAEALDWTHPWDNSRLSLSVRRRILKTYMINHPEMAEIPSRRSCGVFEGYTYSLRGYTRSQRASCMKCSGRPNPTEMRKSAHFLGVVKLAFVRESWYDPHVSSEPLALKPVGLDRYVFSGVSL